MINNDISYPCIEKYWNMRRYWNKLFFPARKGLVNEEFQHTSLQNIHRARNTNYAEIFIISMIIK